MSNKIIGLSATFTGALIGAGFASGREIALYFSHTSPFTPLLAGACLGLLCYFFLELGRIYNGDFFVLFGKTKPVFLITIRLCCFITTCAMIAGGENVIYNLLGIHGGGIITGIIALITLYLGMEKLKFINSLIMPAVIVLIMILLFCDNMAIEFEKLSIIPAFTYATMNIICGGYFVSTLSSNTTKKENMWTGIISGIILGTLLFSIYLIIQNNTDEAMPLMSTATEYNLKVVGNIIMYLAIYTTITSSLSVTSNNNIKNAIATIAFSFIISLFGFKKIVDTTYPIIGLIGAIMVFIIIFLFIKKRRIDLVIVT
jgi:uncharacterized membrane protein YkvI